MTPAEAAARLHCSKQWITVLCQRGDLAATPYRDEYNHDRLRLDPASVEAYAAAHPHPTQGAPRGTGGRYARRAQEAGHAEKLTTRGPQPGPRRHSPTEEAPL